MSSIADFVNCKVGPICLAQCVPASALQENAIHGPLHTAGAHRDR